MNQQQLHQSALIALGTAVVASVLVTWTLTTFTLGRIDRELDQIHRQLQGAYEPMYATPGDAAEEVLDLPDAPEL